MSLPPSTYLGVFPSDYTDVADTLRNEFLTDFNNAGKTRIPDVLNNVFKLYRAVVNAYTDYSDGKVAGDFVLTWNNTYTSNRLTGTDLVNMYILYVQTMQTKISLLFLVADEAYDNFIRYIRVIQQNPGAQISYIKSNQKQIDLI